MCFVNLSDMPNPDPSVPFVENFCHMAKRNAIVAQRCRDT